MRCATAAPGAAARLAPRCPAAPRAPPAAATPPSLLARAAGNKITALPDLSLLSGTLTQLQFNENGVTAWPTLGAATRLTLLDASKNALAGALPAELGLLTALVTLNLSGNKDLDALPEEVGELAALESLNVTGCGLRELPAALAALGGSLLELALDDNGLASLALEPGGGEGGGGGSGEGAGARAEAANWADFSALTTLSARRCRIECSAAALPEALFARTRLSALALGGNAALSAAAVLRLPGCAVFEERRAARISKGMTSDGGDAAADRSFCGLDR